MIIKPLLNFYLQNRPAVLLCIAGFFVYSFLVVYRFVHFAYMDWDMAFVNQTLWNLLNGQLYSSLFGFNFLGDHANFLNLLVLPVFAIFPHPLTFTFVQILLFALSALALNVMATQDLGKWPAFLLTFAYLIFPPNIFAMVHDHNPESLIPVFFFMAVFFYRNKSLKGFYASIVLLALIKENAPLIIAMLSLWGLVAKDRSRILWGVIPLAFSVGYFLAVTSWVIPYFRGMQMHAMWHRYEHLLSNPQKFLFDLFDVSNDQGGIVPYLLSLFGVFLIPAFMSLEVLFLVLPIILYHLLSGNPTEKTIFYNYAVTMTPAIFLATVYTLKKIKKNDFLCMFLCFIFVLGCFWQMHTYRKYLALKIGFLPANLSYLDKWRLIKKIPPDAAVITTFTFMPELSLRSKLYSFHKTYDPHYQDEALLKKSDFYTGKAFRVPDDVEFALIDFNDTWLYESLRVNPDFVSYKINEFLKEWYLVESAGSVKLYKRIPRKI